MKQAKKKRKKKNKENKKKNHYFPYLSNYHGINPTSVHYINFQKTKTKNNKKERTLQAPSHSLFYYNLLLASRFN